MRKKIGKYDRMSCMASGYDYIMWLKINKVAFKTNEDIYIGVVYVPSSDSRFNTIDETNILTWKSLICVYPTSL